MQPSDQTVEETVLADPWSEPFYEGLRVGEVRYLRCGDCDSALPYGARLCPHCGRGHVIWHGSAATGRLCAYVVYHRTYDARFPAPYWVGIMKLVEGPRLLGRLQVTEGQLPRAGLPVRAIVEDGQLRICIEQITEAVRFPDVDPAPPIGRKYR